MPRIWTLLLAICILSLSVGCKRDGASQAGGSNSSNNIVFVNVDSLLNNYQLYTDKRQELEQSYQDAGKAIEAELVKYQEKVASFQKRVSDTQKRAAQIAPVEMQKLQTKFQNEQNALLQQEQQLVTQRDNASKELEMKLVDLQIQLKANIDTYLSQKAESSGYDFILQKATSGGGILYGRNSKDITAECIAQLNLEYKNK